MDTMLAKAIAGGALNILHNYSDVPNLGNGSILGDTLQWQLVPGGFQCLVQYIHARAEYCLCVLRDTHDADLISPSITSPNLNHNSGAVPRFSVPNA